MSSTQEFLKPVNQAVEPVFSNGLPVQIQFKNGFYCPTCNGLKEHTELNGVRTCQGCGFQKSYLKKPSEEQKQRDILNKLYHNCITSYSKRIEAEVIGACLNRKNFGYMAWAYFRDSLPVIELEVD